MNKTVDHWIAVADTLKQQRDQAEKERDDWKRKCLEEACAHDKTRRAWGAEVTDMTRNAMRDGSEFGSLLSERDALRAERDALRKDAARLDWLESLKSYSISNLGGMACAHLWVTDGEDVRVTKTVTKPTIREAIDAAMEAKV
jgi:hypothetical protein